MTTSRPSVGAAALLPLRLFLGATFVYAGLDKILDQRFLDPASPTSIQSQFTIFERTSPLAPLVQLAEPLAVPLGVLIALGEIAVGLGALTGLAYRLSALGGFFFGVMFFLTASWTTHPFYFGPDLPYAVGWLTLGLAGHGDLFVLRLATRTEASDGRPQRLRVEGSCCRSAAWRSSRSGWPRSPASGGCSRRRCRHSKATTQPLPLRAPPRRHRPHRRRNRRRSRHRRRRASPSRPSRTSTPAAHAASRSQSPHRRRFPAGDPALVVALDDGSFAAFDALCTHAGCRVGWDPLTGTIICPCHGAQFDAADHGAVLAGPTDIPLTELPLVVNVQDGTIALRTG